MSNFMNWQPYDGFTPKGGSLVSDNIYWSDADFVFDTSHAQYPNVCLDFQECQKH